jgi:serine/threonine protein kinase
MSSSGPHDWIGQTLADRYHVIEKIGAGGMGTVFKASDTRLGAEVVVKAPHPVMIKDAEFSARFKREIQSLVKLSHPNIVKVMDVGEHDGLPFAVMEYLSGGSLEDRQRPCTPREVAGWLGDVADALDFMHSEGLVHRDIKPGNILFNSSGRAYLGDFGISKVVFESDGDELSGLTGTGTLIGTAEYMSPEILLPSRYGETSDGRSDQYALAVTVYEMLSGHPPFRGDTMAEVVALLVTEEAVPLHVLKTGIPESLSGVVGQALQKQPEDRYASCEAFASSFTAAVEELAGVAVTKPAAQRQSAGAADAGGRQVTQVEAAGGMATPRTPTVLEPSSTPPRRGTMPEKFDPTDLPGTQLDRGETVQETQPSAPDDALRREALAKTDSKSRRLYIGVAAFLFLLVLVAVFSSGSKEPDGFDPDGPDPNAMGPSTDGASLPDAQTGQETLMPDGKRIVSGSDDETLKVWDAQTVKETLTLNGHSESVFSVSFSPDGKRIVSGSRDETLKVWDAQTGKETRTLKGHTNTVSSVSFSPDGKWIVSGSWDNTVKVWDAQTGLMTLTRPLTTGKFGDVPNFQDGVALVSINSVSFSPDGKRIVSGHSDWVKVRDAQTGLLKLTLKGHSGTFTSKRGQVRRAAEVNSVSFSPDGKRIVSGSEDNTLKVWDAQTGKETLTLKGHSGPVFSVSFSPDGKRIVSGSHGNDFMDPGEIKVWDAQTGLETLTLEGHSEPVYSVSFSPDGKRIVSGSGDKTVKVWDISSLATSK